MVFPSNFHVVSIIFHDTFMALQRLLYVGCLCFKGIVETYINSGTRIFSEFMYVSTIPLKHKLTWYLHDISSMIFSLYFHDVSKESPQHFR